MNEFGEGRPAALPLRRCGNALLQLARADVSEEELNSEVELLQDESLLRRVVEENGLERSGVLGWVGLAPNDAEHRVARGMRALGRRMKVDAVRKSDVITVTDDEDDPQLAAAVLTTLAMAYEQKHSVVHRPGGQMPFFSREMKASRERLASAEMQLSEFLQSQSVAAAGLERDNAVQRASELESNPAGTIDEHHHDVRQPATPRSSQGTIAGVATQAHRVIEVVRADIPSGARG